MNTAERADQLMFSFALSVAITLVTTVALDTLLPWLFKDLQIDRVEFGLIAAIVSVLLSLVVPWTVRSLGATHSRTLRDALREPHPDDLQSTWHAQALGILIGLWIGLGLLATLGWGL
ncbi:hypothetical protein LMG19083_04857 [Ralstonia psammae]|uniref:MFS transporter n=1 Tax=Ralstonia psammae TaxID=3058598 RepID=A0ABN9JEA7_9RALS|nr:hypothetical protein [Ralstonia sp. LMG 19083]CAJ0809141.1 hypothetical protein LMG19083_04857 [Ralstonia sp. LMG 19083]